MAFFGVHSRQFLLIMTELKQEMNPDIHVCVGVQ